MAVRVLLFSPLIVSFVLRRASAVWSVWGKGLALFVAVAAFFLVDLLNYLFIYFIYLYVTGALCG